MELFADIKIAQVISTIFYSALGFGLFVLALWMMEKLTHFSIKKEIVEEQNVSMGIVIGAFLIAVGIILAAVID